MNIISISAVHDHLGDTIFGLGDNGRVYYWNWDKGKWVLYSKKEMVDS